MAGKIVDRIVLGPNPDVSEQVEGLVKTTKAAIKKEIKTKSKEVVRSQIKD